MMTHMVSPMFLSSMIVLAGSFLILRSARKEEDPLVRLYGLVVTAILLMVSVVLLVLGFVKVFQKDFPMIPPMGMNSSMSMMNSMNSPMFQQRGPSGMGQQGMNPMRPSFPGKMPGDFRPEVEEDDDTARPQPPLYR